MLLQCSVQVHSLNFLYVTHPQLKKMPHLSLDSLGKEAYLPRPAGGTVEKMGRCFSYYSGFEGYEGCSISLWPNIEGVIVVPIFYYYI